MSEFPKPEQLSRRQRSNAERVSSIIHALTDHIRYETPSEHFQASQSFQIDIPDSQEGFDADGNFHRLQSYSESADIVIERTDQAQLPFTGGGRWDDMGRYDVV